jgi:hypothetical protein
MAGGNRRVRCRACGKSVTFGLSVCPNCGRNPARFHTRWKSTVLSVIFGTALGLVAFPLVPHLETPHPVETPPAVVVAAARPTFTTTPTATAPPTPTATQTSTSTPTPTPTSTAAVVRLVVPTATGTVTPTPKPTAEPPVAISPKDQAEFGGEDTEIFIQWEGTLQEGQQYAVNVRYVGHGDETKVVGTWQRQTRWRLPNSIFRDMSITLRALKWDVMVIDMGGVPVSAPSEARIFSWHP